MKVIEIEDCGIDPEVLKKAKEAIGEEDGRLEQTIEIIREWLKKQKHLNFPDDDRYLAIYARGCKFSLEKMKRKIDLAQSMKALLPEVFTGWDPLNPGIQQALSYGIMLPLQGYDRLGRKVMIYRMGCFPPEKVKVEDMEKASTMVSEIAGYEEPVMFITGAVVIVDFEGYTLNHVTHRPLAFMKKQAKFFQEAGPASPKSMHLIRTSPAFNTIFNLMMGLLNDKMRQRVKVHGSDLESLHKDVPKEILPLEYGGSGPTVAELTAYWKKKTEDNREFLLSREQYKGDESKRPGRPKTAQDLFGMEGSFRQLSVD